MRKGTLSIIIMANQLTNAIIIGVVIAVIVWFLNILFGRPLKAENGTIILMGFVSGVLGYYSFRLVGADKWYCNQ